MARSWTDVHSRIGRQLTGSLLAALTMPTLAVLAASPAHAQQSNGGAFPFSTKCHARSVMLTVDEVYGGEAAIATYEKQSVVISFEPGIKLKPVRYSYKGFEVNQRAREVEIVARTGIAKGTRADTFIVTNKFPLKVKLRIANDPDKTTGYVYVTTRTREQFCRQVLAAPLQQLAAYKARNEELQIQNREQKEQAEEDAKKTEAQIVRTRKVAITEGALYRRQRYFAVRDTNRETTGPMTARITEAQILTNEQGTLVFFDVNNRDPEQFALAEIRISNQQYPDRHVDIVALDVPRTDNEELVATIPGKTRVHGVIMLPDAMNDELDRLSIELRQPSGVGSVVAAAQSWRLRPVSEEELEEEARARQQSLSGRVVTGALWLPDDAGLERLEATRMFGVGVRYLKGFQNKFAFEAEVIAAWTGDASFDGVMVDGTQGQLSRSAVLGRVLLGGMLRFGDKISPNVRIGVGGQALRFNTRFAPVGGGVERDDSVFAVDALWMFGGGLDIRLNERLITGLSASLVGPLTRAGGEGVGLNRNDGLLLELGLRFGYAWDTKARNSDVR